MRVAPAEQLGAISRVKQYAVLKIIEKDWHHATIWGGSISIINSFYQLKVMKAHLLESHIWVLAQPATRDPLFDLSSPRCRHSAQVKNTFFKKKLKTQ